MDTLVAARSVVHKAKHLLGQARASGQFRRCCISTSLVVVAATVDKHAISFAVGTTLATKGPLGKVQVNICGLEHVVADLVEVLDGPDDVCADVPLAVEGLEASPDTDMRVELELRVVVVVGV